MSSNATSLKAILPSPPKVKADVELVGKLLEKTEEKKLSWSKFGHTYNARTPDGALSVHLTGTQHPLFGITWSSFNVTSGSEEIMKVERNSNPLAFMVGAPPSELVSAVDDLLAYLEGTRTREVKKAIAVLNSL